MANKIYNTVQHRQYVNILNPKEHLQLTAELDSKSQNSIESLIYESGIDMPIDGYS